VIGEHAGLMFHTLGQRKGIGIGGMVNSNDEPWYVLEKDIQRNVLIIGQGHDHPKLQSVGLEASQLDWVEPNKILDSIRCTCKVNRMDDNNWQVLFDEKQRAVTPGQSVVFYDGDYCLGGGIIDKILPYRENNQ